MALRTGCPVVSGFLIRAGQGRHRLVFSQEIPVRRTGNLQQDIVENTRVFTHVIESYVRLLPRSLVLAPSALETALVGQDFAEDV